jgi:hypothetical protein
VTQTEIYQRCYAHDRHERAVRGPQYDRHYHNGQTWSFMPKPGELEYLGKRVNAFGQWY